MANPAKYLTCHLCDSWYPVESVAMLCCWDLKDNYQDPEDNFWYMEVKGEYYRLPIWETACTD